MSAELIAALAACKAGDEIVSMLDIYGGTVKLFEDVLARCGIKTRFIPYHDLGNAERYFTRKTRMLFLETPTNPTLRCADIAALSAIAHRHKACVVVDNTFATPVLQKPLALGADIVMHSATKYLGGHSDLTAGVLAGSKQVDGSRPRDDDPHRRMPRSRLCLPAVARIEDPASARGTRLPQRCRHRRRAGSSIPRSRMCTIPDSPSHEAHELATRQMKDYGMMVSFDLRGGEPAVDRFIKQLKALVSGDQPRAESNPSFPIPCSRRTSD